MTPFLWNRPWKGGPRRCRLEDEPFHHRGVHLESVLHWMNVFMFINRRRCWWAVFHGVLCLTLSVPGLTDEVDAQQVPSSRPSESQLLDRLRQSGLSRAETRARLTQLGYDPGLADPYFDRLEGRTNQPLGVTDEFTRALQAMGLVGQPQDDPMRIPRDSLGRVADTIDIAPDT